MTEAVKKNGINYGIAIAIYFVVRTSLMYAVDLQLFTNGWISLVDFIVAIALTVMAISKAKKSFGGDTFLLNRLSLCIF